MDLASLRATLLTVQLAPHRIAPTSHHRIISPSRHLAIHRSPAYARAFNATSPVALAAPLRVPTLDLSFLVRPGLFLRRNSEQHRAYSYFAPALAPAPELLSAQPNPLPFRSPSRFAPAPTLTHGSPPHAVRVRLHADSPRIVAAHTVYCTSGTVLCLCTPVQYSTGLYAWRRQISAPTCLPSLPLLAPERRPNPK